MTSVTIIGAGIIGLTCAWEMARRGHQVHVVEGLRIGAGSSGGHVGALAPHAPDNWNDKKQVQLDSLLAAPDFWKGVEDASGMPTGYGRAGRLQPLTDRDSADRLAARIAASQDRWPVGMQMRITDDPSLAAICDSPSGLWLHDGITARLNPQDALAALAAALRSRGAIITQSRMALPQDIATPALWATGTPGLQMLTDDLGRDMGRGIKGQSALLRLPYDLPAATPQIFADGLHIVPHRDGTVAIGSTSENDFDHLETDRLLDDVVARAKALCPALRDARVIDRWAGLRPRARSRAPVLGPWPGRPGHLIANGGFKIGFGMAPAIAGMMADLLIDGTDRIPDGFRPA